MCTHVPIRSDTADGGDDVDDDGGDGNDDGDDDDDDANGELAGVGIWDSAPVEAGTT